MLIKYFMERLKTSYLSVGIKSIRDKFERQINMLKFISHRVLYSTIAYDDIGSLKFLLSFDKHLNLML